MSTINSFAILQYTPLKMLIIWSQGSVPSVGWLLKNFRIWIKNQPSAKFFILSTVVAASEQQFTHRSKVSFFCPISEHIEKQLVEIENLKKNIELSCKKLIKYQIWKKKETVCWFKMNQWTGS